MTRNEPMTALLHHLRRLTGREVPDAASDGRLLERFAASGAEDAFAALVARHGPMVMRVCRRVLGNEQDAEDAYQATFLVLARKAGTVRKGESLASWLYGVAYHLALRARAAAARRAALRPRPAPAVPDPLAEVSAREVIAVFEEEVEHLPEKYRGPLRLCYLEGQTQEEAARLLGWGADTLRGRLERGRTILRKRLGRRGLALPAALPAAFLAGGIGTAAVPATLAAATVRAATGRGEFGAGAAALAEGALRGASAVRWKAIVALLMLAGLTAAAGLRLARPAPEVAPPAQPAAEGPARKEPPAEPLPPGARVRLGAERLRHGDRVLRVAFVPDGRGLVSTSADGTLRLWDVRSGREERRFGGAADQSGALALSPDGKVLFAGGRVWDVATGRPLPAPEPPAPTAHPTGIGTRIDYPPVIEEGRVVFTPDGRAVVYRYFSHVDFFDIRTGKPVRRTDLPPPPQKTSLADGYRRKLSPDGKLAGLARMDSGQDSALFVRDTTTGKEVARLGRAGEHCGEFAFSPDGKVVAVATQTMARGMPKWEGSVRLWDVAAGKNTRTFEPGGHVSSVLFSPDGKVLAANVIYRGKGRRDTGQRLHLWDVRTGKEVGRLPGVVAQAFSPDGKLVAGASGNTVRLWEVPGGKELHPYDGPRNGLLAVACSADGRTIATEDMDGRLCLLRADTGRLLHAAQTHNPFYASANHENRVALSPDGRTLAASGPDSVTHLFDVATGRELRSLTIRTAGGGGWALAFSPDGRTLAVGCAEGENGVMALWDVPPRGEGNASVPLRPSSKEVRRLPWPKMRPGCSAFSPDGRTLAASSQEEGMRLWEVGSGRLLRQWQGQRATALAFSPDGRCLAAAAQWKPEVRVWETATGLERCRLLGHTQGVRTVAFSPDGRTLASAGCDGTVRLWDWPGGRQRRCLRGHAAKPTASGFFRDGSGGVAALAFTPDGRRLVTGGEDATVLVWDLTHSTAEPRAGGHVSDEELRQAWTDLAGGDGRRAHAAVVALVKAGDRGVRFLAGRLRPAAGIDAERVRRLLADLESEAFTTRQKAAEDLEALGEHVEPVLRKALAAGPPLETRRRLERILERLGPDRLRDGRAVEALELTGTAAARDALRALAKGTPDARLTRESRAALGRLPRS